jgi:hypothetical protein
MRVRDFNNKEYYDLRTKVQRARSFNRSLKMLIPQFEELMSTNYEHVDVKQQSNMINAALKFKKDNSAIIEEHNSSKDDDFREGESNVETQIKSQITQLSSIESLLMFLRGVEKAEFYNVNEFDYENLFAKINSEDLKVVSRIYEISAERTKMKYNNDISQFITSYDDTLNLNNIKSEIFGNSAVYYFKQFKIDNLSILDLQYKRDSLMRSLKEVCKSLQNIFKNNKDEKIANLIELVGTFDITESLTEENIVNLRATISEGSLTLIKDPRAKIFEWVRTMTIFYFEIKKLLNSIEIKENLSKIDKIIIHIKQNLHIIASYQDSLRNVQLLISPHSTPLTNNLKNSKEAFKGINPRVVNLDPYISLEHGVSEELTTKNSLLSVASNNLARKRIVLFLDKFKGIDVGNMIEYFENNKKTSFQAYKANAKFALKQFLSYKEYFSHAYDTTFEHTDSENETVQENLHFYIHNNPKELSVLKAIIQPFKQFRDQTKTESEASDKYTDSLVKQFGLDKIDTVKQVLLFTEMHFRQITFDEDIQLELESQYHSRSVLVEIFTKITELGKLRFETEVTNYMKETLDNIKSKGLKASKDKIALLKTQLGNSISWDDKLEKIISIDEYNDIFIKHDVAWVSFLSETNDYIYKMSDFLTSSYYEKFCDEVINNLNEMISLSDMELVKGKQAAISIDKITSFDLDAENKFFIRKKYKCILDIKGKENKHINTTFHNIDYFEVKRLMQFQLAYIKYLLVHKLNDSVHQKKFKMYNLLDNDELKLVVLDISINPLDYAILGKYDRKDPLIKEGSLIYLRDY